MERENKQQICDLLCKALQATRNASDLVSLDYDKDREVVYIKSIYGTKTVNVACDSGTAMIRDIMGKID